MSTINPPKCTQCGELNSPRASHCIMCGNPLLAIQHPQAEATTLPEPESSPVTSSSNRSKLGLIIGIGGTFVLIASYVLVKTVSGPSNQPSQVIVTRNPVSRTGKALTNRELISAAKTGDIPSIQAFIDSGNHPDTPIPNRSKFSILMYAASGNQVDMILFLLDKGANVEYKSADGFTPLMLAGMRGSVEAIHLLLGEGASVKTRANGGMTALSLAVAAGKTDAAKILLDKGSDPNNPTKDGMTELHMAAARNHPEVTKVLLAKGADPKAKDVYGNSALDYALKSGHSDIAQTLREAGAPTNTTN